MVGKILKLWSRNNYVDSNLFRAFVPEKMQHQACSFSICDVFKNKQIPYYHRLENPSDPCEIKAFNWKGFSKDDFEGIE
jgi:hypothetical protein